MSNPALTGEELSQRLRAITDTSNMNVYVYDARGKLRRVVGVAVDLDAIFIETEEV